VAHNAVDTASCYIHSRRKKMIRKIEEFLFGKVFGSVIVRLAGAAAIWVATKAAAGGVDVNADQLAAALIAGANAAYSWTKKWRDERAAKVAEAPKP
jgi:hypothetical protein